MIWIVRVALERPYTFIVMALLILIMGPMAAIETPTDIFPDIGMPVIGVAWKYTGLSPDEMAGRIITPYERVLSTTVNDIEHIESQSLPGIGIVKIFFQPGVDIRTATAQVTSISQTVLKQMPPGITPPLILNYNASTVPILQLPLPSQHAVRAAAVRPYAELHPPGAGHRAGRRHSLPLWRQGAADPGRPRSAGAAAEGPVGRRTSRTPSPPRTRSSRPAPPRSAPFNTT